MGHHLFVAAALCLGLMQPVQFGLSRSGPAVYRLDGYLDRAPEGTTVYYRTVIGYGARSRTFRITEYFRQGDGDPFVMFRNLGMFTPDFILLGRDAPLEALIKAREGARVRGTFLYRRGLHTLEVDTNSLTID